MQHLLQHYNTTNISGAGVALGALGAAGVGGEDVEAVESSQLEEVALPFFLAVRTQHLGESG